MLGHPRNNFTYLGPSDIGTWAHHTKWNWFGKTSGFVKPVTDKRKGNPKNCFFWEILGFFLRKSFSQHPNTPRLWLEIFNSVKDLHSTQKNTCQAVLRRLQITESSSRLHMQEIESFLNSFKKLFATGEKDEDWEEKISICMLYK